MVEGPDDVRARDTVQGRQSLAARCGLRLTFPAPDQGRYLQIVERLVKERRSEIDGRELAERAVLWDRRQAGRYVRNACRFVDKLEARLADDPNPSS